MSQHAGISVREANGEVVVFIGRNAPTKLAALEEASRMIQREIIREKEKEGK